MNNLAIIPARGGSKRIPRKNIRDFLGKPIINYSIEAALGSGVFQEVMVSTDDDEIAEVALKAGAKVPFMRSKETATDFSTTVEVIKEVLDSYDKTGLKFDNFCILFPTAPFVTAHRLKMAYDILMSSGADSILPITEFSYPIFRSLKIDNSLVQFNWPEYVNSRSQDLTPTYHDCGQFLMMQISKFLGKDKVITDFTVPIIIPSSETQDIDNEDDWNLAELKYRKLTSRV